MVANVSNKLRIYKYTGIKQVSFYKADFVSLHQRKWEMV